MPRRRVVVPLLARIITVAYPVGLDGSSQDDRICLVQLVLRVSLTTCLGAKIVRGVVSVSLHLAMATYFAKAVLAALFNQSKVLEAVKCALRARSQKQKVHLFVRSVPMALQLLA